MQIFIDACQKALDESNWISALTLSLTIPDIAGKVAYGSDRVGERYAKWFDKYVGPKYTSTMYGGITHVFLTGKDCYALRCALLHEGTPDVSNQKAKNIYDYYRFVMPVNKNWAVHCNRIGQILELQINIFADDIIQGAKQWLSDIKNDYQKQEKIANMLKIIKIQDTGTFTYPIR